MSQITQIADTLPYYGEKKLLVKDHNTDDIVNAIKKHHKLYRKNYDEIAKDFWAGDVASTAKRLFDFSKKYIRYDIEHPDNQTVKSPGAIVAQRHGDCKHYASLTNGICAALQRAGYPISSSYRFVADAPGVEVHHVFAVINDGKKEYWVDPVLNTFNERPIFHNHKNVSMGNLYSISGLNAHGRPEDLPIVGNFFSDIAHSMDVNLKNIAKGVKVNTQNIAHGVQVNTHNLAHGIKVNAENAAKGAKQVTHMALNVGLAPARNAYLALLDLNAFNLATRMSSAWTNHNAAVKSQWEKLGGNSSKLLAAINNGRKHKAYYHNQAPAKRLSGVHCNAVPTLMHSYATGQDSYGRLAVVSGIGEPISVATLTALASAIIAIMAKFMTPDHSGDQTAAVTAQQGIANMVKNASDAIEAGDVAKGQNIMKAVKDGSGLINPNSTMQLAAGVGEDGYTPTLAVTDFKHPQLDQAGSRYEAQPDDLQITPADSLTNSITKLPAKITNHIFDDVKEWVFNVWQDYKTPILFTTVGVAAYKIATRKKKKGR